MRAIAGAGMIAAMLVAAGAADAQRAGSAGASYPVPGRAAMPAAPVRAMPSAPARSIVAAQRGTTMRAGPRWQMRQGRWAAGWNAPGGWNGYRRPYAGWALPPYWVQPGFALGNWSAYGLAQPRAGYRWSRYYDDAVLIDARGSVYDTVGGIDWDHYDGGSYEMAGDHGPPPPYPPARRDPRMGDNGLGGAAIGAVAGGVAGNVIAGRGNRLGGTLIGAGVGAAAGYAIDKGEDRGRDRRGRDGYAYRDDRSHDNGGYERRGYDDRGYGAGYPPPPVAHGYGGGEHWVSQDGHTIVTTGGGADYYGGGTTTTVTVQSAPVVTTTTTTEYYEDAPRRTWHAKRRVKSKAMCCRR